VLLDFGCSFCPQPLGGFLDQQFFDEVLKFG
jgi:hypothetical protein